MVQSDIKIKHSGKEQAHNKNIHISIISNISACKRSKPSSDFSFVKVYDEKSVQKQETTIKLYSLTIIEEKAIFLFPVCSKINNMQQNTAFICVKNSLRLDLSESSSSILIFKSQSLHNELSVFAFISVFI